MINPEITLGQLIPVVLLAVGAIGAWFTLKANSASTAESLRTTSASIAETTKGLATRLDKTDTEIDTLRRHVDRNCVEHAHLRDVETRLSGRIAEVEHTVKQVPMQVVGLLNGVPGGPGRRRGTTP